MQGCLIRKECADFKTSFNEICPDEQPASSFQLAISISGGTPPYTVDVDGYYFNDSVELEDLPLPAIGDIPNASLITVTISDANGCGEGPIFQFIDCNKVDVELLTFDGEVLKEGISSNG